MANTKLSAFFSLLLVFCSGAVVGVFSYRVYNTSVTATPKAPEKRQSLSPEEFRKQATQEMVREVHLDDQQVLRLEQIYDETKTQFDDMHNKFDAAGRGIRDDQIAKIKAMLRPDQVPLYEALHARKEAERAQRRRGKGGIAPADKDRGGK